MNIFELLFSNPLFIVIALGLINYLASKSKQGEKEKTETNRQERPVQQHIPRQQERTESIPNVPLEQIETVSVEELRQQQLDRLTNQIQRNSSSDLYDDITEQQTPIKQPKNNQTERKPKNKKTTKLHDRLTDHGLIDSIIMSEVLGPPRALKRYNSNRLK